MADEFNFVFILKVENQKIETQRKPGNPPKIGRPGSHPKFTEIPR
jgi:hypothetical protein